MLSISKIESLNHGLDYYTKDNYYTKEEQKDFTQWYGNAAKLLGLKGTVEVNAFKKALYGVSRDGKFENEKKDNEKSDYISYASIYRFKKNCSEYLNNNNLSEVSKKKIQNIF